MFKSTQKRLLNKKSWQKIACNYCPVRGFPFGRLWLPVVAPASPVICRGVMYHPEQEHTHRGTQRANRAETSGRVIGLPVRGVFLLPCHRSGLSSRQSIERTGQEHRAKLSGFLLRGVPCHRSVVYHLGKG